MRPGLSSNHLRMAGALASFNAHVGTFGTYVDDNPPEDTGDEVLFGIIDKLMTWFE